MLRNSGRVSLLALLAYGLMASNGCALFDQMTKTKTADSDAKMNLGEYKGVKQAIGCKEFENQAGWHGNWDLGDNMSIMLESALFDTGRFVLVEREKLKDVIGEQDLAASGRTAKAANVAKTGLIRPARYLATGAVTVAEEGTSGGGGGIGIGGIRVGGGKSSATITIIAKLIDTTTGEIVQKKSITGKAGRVALNLGVAGTIGGHGFATDMGGFAKTPMGEAAQDCINEAAKFFAQAMQSVPFDACVVQGKDGKVIINRGQQFGLAVGQKMTMREEGELLTDPGTGEVLERKEGAVIGKITVTKVSEKVSYCDVTEGEQNPKPGTNVTTE